jgi:thioredoxin reductase
MVDIAIIGAGPFGLSIAAHLKSAGIDFRVFGAPMHTWLNQMPQGMRLKSEGFASSLFDPRSSFTLEHYCREKGLPYADTGLPVRLDTFSSYGLEFQKRFVPELEKKTVTALHRVGSAFRLGLHTGEFVDARRVVVAVGLTHFQRIPDVLSSLPREVSTHSSQHRSFDEFSGREVAIIGAGASAVDSAALLHQAGASVQLIARRPTIKFHDPPGPLPRPILQRLRAPTTGIGNGWRLAFYAKAPRLFRQLPEQVRLKQVKRVLGPAPGWFVRDEVVGKVPFNTGVSISRANVQNGRVHLQLVDRSGACQNLVSDHVISATGYQVDLHRLNFLSPEMLSEIRSVENTPVLSSQFESSIPGLYFVGVMSANTFGPLVRFAYGAGFTARHLSRHLAGTKSRTKVREEACVTA